MSVASVAVPVNRVKKIRHNLSITIAANFQSACTVINTNIKLLYEVGGRLPQYCPSPHFL